MKPIRRTVAAIAIAWAAILAPLHAQDPRAAARDTVKKWQEAVVNVRIVLTMRMSMGGREMNSSDESVDTVGTVIDPSGHSRTTSSSSYWSMKISGHSRVGVWWRRATICRTHSS